MIRYLTVDEVLYMHQRTLERTGGTGGVRDWHLLESALARPRAMAGGVDVHPTLARKAAVLMYSLVLNHLFIDGNKRMGLQCLDVFLHLNGVRLRADAATRYQFLTDVANEALSIEEMAAWVETHSEPLKAPAPAAAARSRSRSQVPKRRVSIAGFADPEPQIQNGDKGKA